MDVGAKFVISTLLIVSFLAVAVSGIMLLYEWDKAMHQFLKEVHILSGILMVVLVVIHFIGNYTLYVNEAKAFFR